MQHLINRRFGATYGCNAYGADTYNSSDVCGASTQTPPGPLAPTGESMLVTAVGGLVLIVIGIVLLVVVRKKKT